MKVAVPLLQHSQWFGHFALSQTVWSFKSSNSSRVFVNALLAGRDTFNQSGSRLRDRRTIGDGAASIVVPEPHVLIRPANMGVARRMASAGSTFASKPIHHPADQFLEIVRR
jgi:hypothetical protein